jgi:alcohol dehydrogenase
MTYGCPAGVTAASGIDALVHSIEAYTSTKSNNFTDALALESIRLINGSLRTAVKSGSDKEARSSMAEAALYGGIAFCNSGTAVVHAISHVLGAHFHVSHGVANGLLLSYVNECNMSADFPKYAIVAGMLGVKTEGISQEEAARRGVKAAQDLAKDIGIPIHLRDVGVPRDALKKMADETMEATGFLNNNPRKLTLNDVMGILEKAW